MAARACWHAAKRWLERREQCAATLDQPRTTTCGRPRDARRANRARHGCQRRCSCRIARTWNSRRPSSSARGARARRAGCQGRAVAAMQRDHCRPRLRCANRQPPAEDIREAHFHRAGTGCATAGAARTTARIMHTAAYRKRARRHAGGLHGAQVSQNSSPGLGFGNVTMATRAGALAHFSPRRPRRALLAKHRRDQDQPQRPGRRPDARQPHLGAGLRESGRSCAGALRPPEFPQ